MGKHLSESIRVPIEADNPAIRRIENLCIKCGQCRDICRDYISVLGYYDLSKTNDTAVCIHCGQCANVCPVSSITETPEMDAVIAAAKDPDKVLIVSTSPSVRVSLGEAFGMQRGSFVEGKMIITDYYSTKYADTTLFKRGTEIVSVNGMDVESICDSLRKFYSVSNEASFYRQVAFNMLRTNENEISIGYTIDSISLSDTVIQIPLANDCLSDYWSSNKQPKELFAKLNDSVGYTDMSYSGYISRSEIEKFVHSVSHLIIDLRNADRGGALVGFHDHRISYLSCVHSLIELFLIHP